MNSKGKKMKIQQAFKQLDIEDLRPVRVQPPWRTTPTALASLMASIEEIGVQEPPYVGQIGDKYYLINGNRRTAASKALGHKKITCRVVAAPSVQHAEYLFGLLDGVTRKVMRSVFHFMAQKPPGEKAPTARAVVLWLIRHKAQVFVRETIKNGKVRDAQKLLKLITSDTAPRT